MFLNNNKGFVGYFFPLRRICFEALGASPSTLLRGRRRLLGGMGKKTKKPGKGKEKTERKTAKAEEKRSRRESNKNTSQEDDIDAILVCFGFLIA